jgi:hypothetical protein
MGLNDAGQVGDRTMANRLMPVRLAGPVDTLAIGAAENLLAATAGRRLGLGDNTFGQLGDGTTTARLGRRRSRLTGMMAVAESGPRWRSRPTRRSVVGRQR